MQDWQPLLAAMLAFAAVFAAYAFLGRWRRRRGGQLDIGADRASATAQGHVPARVARVIDGDTVDVAIERRIVRIRLDSIDCPEDGQPWGDTARFGLIKLIGGRTVHLEIHGQDGYGRTLATIHIPRDGGGAWVNVNERMVALGHAWVMRRYYNHLPRHRRNALNRIEAWAKSRRVGLWQTENPVRPWKWRAAMRNVFR